LRDYYPVNDSMKPEFSEGKIDVTGASNTAFRRFRANRENILGGGLGGRKQYKAALDLMREHHKNVMEWSAAQYSHETGFQSHMAGLSEIAAASEHSRTEAMQKAINKAAEGGTGVSFSKGDFSAQYTKAQPKARKPKSTGPKNFPAVKTSEEPQMEAPTMSSPTVKSSGGPSVTRDSKGRAVSLKNKAATSAPAETKSTPKAGPSVTRDPKTGRARSLKKK
jgi:hypothetical protein